MVKEICIYPPGYYVHPGRLCLCCKNKIVVDSPDATLCSKCYPFYHPEKLECFHGEKVRKEGKKIKNP